jgi:two-component system LytT family response regulator
VTDPLRALVVDDEGLARRGLRLRLEEIDGVDVVGECRNGREALACIAEQAPDLLFLDIQMPGMDGLALVRELQSDAMPLVVFVTAYDQYAVQAFDLHAVDYLLKPVESERLAEAVGRARRLLGDRGAATEKARLLELVRTLSDDGSIPGALDAEDRGPGFPERLVIRDGAETTLVPVATIDWVDAAGDYMCIHAAGQTHIMRSTMKALEAQLDPDRFLRIHRSTLVNAARVTKVRNHINGEFFLVLEGGTSLKMSRSYRDRIDRVLGAG